MQGVYWIYKTDVIPSAWYRYTGILWEHHTIRREGYIRTLIRVLSLVLRDQYKSISIGYILVSDSSALNQQPSTRARLALFLYSLPCSILFVDYPTEPGGGDLPINAYNLLNRTRRGTEHTDILGNT